MGDVTSPPETPQGDAGLKERFFRYFQQEVAALNQEIERLGNVSKVAFERNDAIDHALAGIERLSHAVKDAASYIPAYDQRTYGETIKGLSEKLQTVRNAAAPPKKFSFKSGRKTAPINAVASSVTIPLEPRDTGTANPPTFSSLAPDRKEAHSLEENSEQKDNHKGLENTAHTLTISNKTSTHLTLPTLSLTSPPTSATIIHITHSIIDLSALPTTTAKPLATLTLKEISHSLIICGQVCGPTHITSLSNTVLVVACRQFRMHGSKDVDVYLHCSSRPIIEDCEGVRFAPLPGNYVTDALRKERNCWDQIDDFKWLKAEPSPHFSLMDGEKRVKKDAWKDLMEGGQKENVDKVLGVIGVRI